MAATRAGGALLVVACAATIAGCSSNDSTNTTGNSVTMSAKINGSSFASVGSSFSYTGTTLSVVGFDLNYTITFSVGGITAPGTYAITSNAHQVIFIVSKTPNSGWDTLGAGSTGTVTITTLSATHVAGTFSFSAIPQSGTTGAMVVTQGAFDITK